jgi:hypothetical protein
MDSCLTNRQAQRLLRMINRAESACAAAKDTGTEGLSPIGQSNPGELSSMAAEGRLA